MGAPPPCPAAAPLPALLPLNPPRSIAHLSCTRLCYLLRLKPALQHCKSSLEFVFFSLPPQPLLLLCFLAQSALKQCSFCSFFFSCCGCPQLPTRGDMGGGEEGLSGAQYCTGTRLWLCSDHVAAHTISKQSRSYRSGVGS